MGLVPESYDILSQSERSIKVVLDYETGSDGIPIARLQSTMLRPMNYEIFHSPALLDLCDPKNDREQSEERVEQRCST